VDISRDECLARIEAVRVEVVTHPHTRSASDPALLVLRGLREFADLPDHRRPMYATLARAAEKRLEEWRAIVSSR
jgi:hypothetical protein